MLEQLGQKNVFNKTVETLQDGEEPVSVLVDRMKRRGWTLTDRHRIIVAFAGDGFKERPYKAVVNTINLDSVSEVGLLPYGLSIRTISGDNYSLTTDDRQMCQAFSKAVHTQQEKAKVNERSTGSTESVADQLTKLAALRDSGVLTEVEFQQQKAAIL